MSPEELARLDRNAVWHPFTQMAEYEPFIIERAAGCTLYDLQGNAYLDGASSMWCNVHGHAHPKLNAALTAQAAKVSHVTALGASNPAAIELAGRLVDMTSAELNHVFFSGDGSSAIEVALKMAFQYWRQKAQPEPKRVAYIAFDDAYHGDTIGSVSLGGVARFHDMFEPLLFDVVRLPSPRTFRPPAGVDPEATCDFYLSQLSHALQQRPGEVAAVVIEPLVQGAAGMITHPPGFLQGVRRLTRNHNVLLIADEVAVGFGRTGKMFACEHEDVAPDLLCLGKGLTAGYLAMSATLATTEIYNAFLGDYGESKSLFHGHTYAGNPLAAAVANASLDLFESERTLENLQPKIASLTERLAVLKDHPHVGDIRQCGLLAGVELVRDRNTNEPYHWEERRGQRVCDHALTKGVWIRPLGNVVVIIPPLAITLEDLDQICDAVIEGVQVATDSQVKA